ncbi:hypothetical protein G9C85_01400 [Halorubellus sp. JP-L1]|uniref:hypothetical protein n=1 Tax=Halorubellus sp. JP-L1 TaxID=2715753 RepID=UPI00140869D9|nr:hypothetical protein [Halorubellus sp. JP-L1]NHN40291.1 hypothetical protein [Halorubellus sp. JP-L1]
MHEDTAHELGWSLAIGAWYAVVGFASVLAVGALSTAFVAPLDFVLSATAGVLLAATVLWWRGAERPGVRTRRRSAAVGAVVGLVSPTLAFALNPVVYGSSAGFLVRLASGVVAAGVLGLNALLATFGLTVVLGALTGWSTAGWISLLRE